MKLIVTSYIYQNVFARKEQKVRIYSEKEGANGRVVLEDIVEILLTEIVSIPSKKSSNRTDYNLLTITQDKIQLADIATIEYKGLHLADVEQLYNFYSFCDDLAETEIYESLGNWLNFQVCTLINKRLAHLGEMVRQIPFWEEYASKVSKIFDENQKITIREWLLKSYGLTVPGVLTIFTNKVKNMMGSAYNVNAGEKPDKNEGNVNVYYPKNFGFVAQRIDWWASNNDWNWLREVIKNSVVVKSTLDDEKKQVRILKKEGRSIDDIVQIIWGVSPTSNLVDNKNYQYKILKAFIQMV
ncbi:hypothetical protein [[Scytonema hofmanni] UTEX B 1581]|uniref:hypothetical protein n=1 Tax=[Scytonema hofmanni] UTEX B 1581 TaxID=379535 RepID=UPI00049786AF|nr:hypothetical protein [[Scytonema hofmanni] UTEX B 1581]